MNATFYIPAAKAFVSHNTDAPVIAVKGFERGYYPIYTRRDADFLNKGKWSADELQSALEASVFGWDTPAARLAISAIESKEKESVS